MRKRLKLVLLSILLFCASCASTGGVSKMQLRRMESQDHKDCLFAIEGKNFKNSDELYWRCRVKAINERIYEAKNTQKSFIYQEKLQEIRDILESRIVQAENENFANRQKDIWKMEHQICILENKLDENFSKEYDNCRKTLLISRTAPKPFGRKSYQFIANQDIKNPRNLEEVINNKKLNEGAMLTINQQADATAKLVEIFPVCSQYNVKSDEFELCIKKESSAKKCQEDIPQKIEQRKLDDQMFCKKKAIEEFPDSLALFDTTQPKQEIKTEETKEAEKIEEKKEDKLASLLGLTKKEETNGKTKTEEESQKQEEVSTYDTNLGPKFSRQDVLESRDKAYSKCMRQRNKKLSEYRKFLPEECDELKENIKEVKI